MTTPLQKAAQSVIDRWNSPAWKDQPHTAEYIEGLRKALDAEIAQAVEPYAVFHGLVDSGEHGAFNLDLLKMIPRGAYLYLHPPQQSVCTSDEWLANCPQSVRDLANKIKAELHPPQPQATTPVPEGYVLVPIEPTDEMIDAGCDSSEGDLVDMVMTYKAMLAAAQGEKS